MTNTTKLCVFCVIAGRSTCRITRKRGKTHKRCADMAPAARLPVQGR